MKYTFIQTDGEEEIILKYRQKTDEIESLMNYITGKTDRILAIDEKGQVVLDKKDILYIESVDGKTFVYTDNQVLRLNYSLTQVSEMMSDINFFRRSKSVIVNIDKITALKSLSSNRIDATMTSGEHIIISRTYATNLRRILKGENDYE